jgi:hypothetical protein
MPGLTASNLPVVCCVGEVTCTRNAQKRAIHHRYRHAATAGWWTERNLIPPTIEAEATERERKSRRSAQDYKRKGALFQPHYPRTILRGAVLRSVTQQQEQPQSPSVAQACTPSLEGQPTSTKSVSKFRLLMQTVRL